MEQEGAPMHIAACLLPLAIVTPLWLRGGWSGQKVVTMGTSNMVGFTKQWRGRRRVSRKGIVDFRGSHKCTLWTLLKCHLP